ncbi:MAG: hypothetical protein AMQ22_00216 [Candidatus Methanofastidiosum methylothiophilum]|uniref:Uncharacterized protein n=1 Tax=Candidatus Methanofastidiosum methylothiophilum TaxID=1705564 RepID=A0A150ISE8_9EURY|nr:MAG: hypothetical protein APG11_00827 [Candidatus Methanofastidiosum methylthiophilus]KYC53545.1 MAG: hypothetical protein AMQ22_00216 [Candidatus Methanofastidiosum methylthiophilus]
MFIYLNKPTIKDLAKKCLEISNNKGFDTSNHLKQLLLIGTEVNEALDNVSYEKTTDSTLRGIINEYQSLMKSFEILRTTFDLPEKSNLLKTGNMSEELADIVIRVMVYAEGNGIDLEKAILEKMKINEQRPKLHNKKF